MYSEFLPPLISISLLLIKYFLKGNEIKEDNLRFLDDPEIIKIIQEYDWPGNIRELENAVKRFAILPEGELIEVLSGFNEKLGNQSTGLNNKIQELEKKEIIEVLKRYNYNRRLTAESLGISEATLYRKIRHYRLDI